MITDDIRHSIRSTLDVLSDRDITEEIPITRGRSGAEVYQIRVRSSRPEKTGTYIVKIGAAGENGGQTKEFQVWRYVQDNLRDCATHFTKLVASPQIIKQRRVVIYNYANSRVLGSCALSDLEWEKQSKRTFEVFRDLLCEIAKPDEHYGGTANGFFSTLLSKQLGDRGRFVPRMKDLLQSPEAKSVNINGKIYPNPLYFLTNIDLWKPMEMEHYYYKGFVHGDLHGQNILVSEDSYALIDYDDVVFDSYLLFDHAYYEFSVFYDNSKDNDLEKWRKMLERLISIPVLDDAQPCEFVMEYTARNAICRSIREWIEQRDIQNQIEFIEVQFLMARIAAGVNFFSKRSCEKEHDRLKALLYIAHCFGVLLDYIHFPYNKADAGNLKLSPGLLDADLWDDFVGESQYYAPILVTDDKYSPEERLKLKGLCSMKWGMAIDIGSEESEPIVASVLLETFHSIATKSVRVKEGEKVEHCSGTLNVLSIRKEDTPSYYSLWRKFGTVILAALRKLMAEYPGLPLLFVFDCDKDSAIFRDELIRRLSDDQTNFLESARFVALREPFSPSEKPRYEEMREDYQWVFTESNANLLDVASTCQAYRGEQFEEDGQVKIPKHGGGWETLSKETVQKIETCMELVYPNCEYRARTSEGMIGLDISGEGESFGEEFYKGNEATWSDFKNGYVLPLYSSDEYERIKRDLENRIEKIETRRAKTESLYHGAGCGGTTFAKQLLWDFRNKYPCVRLKKYTSDTADILIDLYGRTGKCILLAVEASSLVATDEDLDQLRGKVQDRKARLMILEVKRTAPDTMNQRRDLIIPFLKYTMPTDISRTFFNRFSEYAHRRPNGQERVQMLEKISGINTWRYREESTAWEKQRSPFFYGFYTFQEEYNLLKNLRSTVSDCTKKSNLKELLNSLAVLTRFSQTACVQFWEFQSILSSDEAVGESRNLHLLLLNLPKPLRRLITKHEKGFRLCHSFLAEQALRLLHTPEGEDAYPFKNVVFDAIKDYIETLSEHYAQEHEYVDDILRELIIDRAEIDSENRNVFSHLVKLIPQKTKKEELFLFLTEKFPQNPHYYNHLARLQAWSGDETTPMYDQALENAQKAIDIAKEMNLNISFHATTLGCIYGQWIIRDLKDAQANVRSNRLATPYGELISSFSERYDKARSAFELARKNAERYDSFCYFPQINLESGIISAMIRCGNGRNLDRLLEQEPEFRRWYHEHLSIAAELMSETEHRLGVEVSEHEQEMQKKSKLKLEEISHVNDGIIKKRLSELLNSDNSSDLISRRSLVYAMYAKCGSDWSRFDPEMCRLGMESFKKNIESGSFNSGDLETWFNLYRRLDDFDPLYAERFIADYYEEDNYRKEYLLFLTSFINWKQNNGTASAILNRIFNLRERTRQKAIGNLRELDGYLGRHSGCPIVPVGDLPRDVNGEPIDMEIFTGTVQESGRTHGTIRLQGTNLEVTFIPQPTFRLETLSQQERERRLFDDHDKGKRVQFNLMFSYSGLRGRNVIKI